jgi:uncharacterized protein YndB with AHSA1/START domain
MAEETSNHPRAEDGKRHDLIITRLFDAPRELVWKAWTDPNHLMQWWGPKMFTAPVCRIDLRIGGTYLFCMRSAEGQDFWSTGVYREIVPLKRLVCTDSFADEQGTIVPASHYGVTDEMPLEMMITVTFEDFQDDTRMTLKHSGLPEGKMGELAGLGWSESFDKLARALM